MRNPFVIVALLALGACGGEPVQTETLASHAVDLSDPTVLAGVANELSASPDQADAILSRHGLTRATFDAAMYEVAADPTKSATYQAARR